MERLTHERCNGIKTGYWTAAKKEELVERLAMYENIAYSPEALKRLLLSVSKPCVRGDIRLIDAYQLDEMLSVLRHPYFGIDDARAMIAEAPTVPAVTLPCYVGDTVYRTDGVNIFEEKINNLVYLTENGGFDETAIGTSIFLSREEAEQKK